jgi:hypothetical protein
MLLKLNLKQRRKRGAAIIGLTIAIFIFLLCIGLFCFDASRAQMAQRELVALCDSAALTGTSMLASFDVDNDDTNYTKLFDAQQQAMAYSANMVRYGSILGTGVNTTNSKVFATVDLSAYVAAPVTAGSQSSLFSPAPATGFTNIFLQYVDSANGYAPVDISTPSARPNGRALQVQTCYGYKPVFFSIFNIVNLGTYLLNASSVGGLPQVDTVMAFDFSGSMDDQTYCTFVDRVWNNTGATAPGGQIDYRVCPRSNTGDNLLCHQLTWDYNPALGRNGFAVNVLPPQNLCFIGSEYTGSATSVSPNELQPDNHEFFYDARVRSNYGQGLTPTPDDYGSPPGNCFAKYSTAAAVPYGNANYTAFASNTFTPSAYTDCNPPVSMSAPQGGCNRVNCFTDLVVNIDDPQVGQTSPGGQAPPSYPAGGWIQPIYPRPDWQTHYFGYNNATGVSITFSNGTYTIPDVSNPGNSVTLCWEPDSRLQGQTFNFPNLATLVEAARGNMDSPANLSNAFNLGGSTQPTNSSVVPGVAWTAAGFPTPKANYQLAYQRLAMLYSQPIATAVDGAFAGFYQKLNVLADCRFGFVGFSAATQAIDTPFPSFPGNTTSQFFDQRANYYTSPVDGFAVVTRPGDVASYASKKFYYYGAPTTGPRPTNNSQGARVPRYQLAAATPQTTEVLAVCGQSNSEPANGTGGIWSDLANGNGLENGTPLTRTEISEALKCAADEFTSGGSLYDWTATSGATARPAARRAVVLFTDGEPTDQGAGIPPVGLAATAANQIKSQGSSLFCIGLNVNGNGTLANDQVTYLGETSGGLCELAGNGSKFFPCTDSTQVKKAFAAVVRRLTQGQR